MKDNKVIHRGLAERLPELWKGVRWYLQQMWSQFLAHDCLNAAGALTYTTLFAVVPMMAVTYTVFSLIPEYGQIGTQVENFVFSNFVPGSSDVVQSKLAEFAQHARNLTPIGFLILFVTAFMTLITIEKSFNTIWHVAVPRRGLQRFLLYWGVLSLGHASLIVGLLTSLYLVSLPLVSDKEINAVVTLNQAEHNKMFEIFQEFKLLSQTEDEHWILGRNLKAVTLWDLYQRLPDGLSLARLKTISDLPQVVEPLISITQFGSNEMSVTMDSVLAL